MRPVESLAQYKSLTRNTTPRSTPYTPGTTDVASMERQLLRECSNNLHLMNFIRQHPRGPRKKQSRSCQGKSQKTSQISSDSESTSSSSRGSTPAKRYKHSKTSKKSKKRRRVSRRDSSSSSSSGSNSDASPISSKGVGRGPKSTPFYYPRPR
uniref:ORF3 n=1 Tax=Torque teno virus TaxID=68887 RepID=A0A5B8NGL6_9VIRU|nr:ORF3 [Torque teno virus]